MPEEEEAYQSNPLWERLAKSLNFKLTFSKAKRAPRHINIGELRGALKAERIGAMRRPGGRLLVGLDSQVALGALIKVGVPRRPSMPNFAVLSLTWCSWTTQLSTFTFTPGSTPPTIPLEGKRFVLQRKSCRLGGKRLRRADLRSLMSG